MGKIIRIGILSAVLLYVIWLSYAWVTANKIQEQHIQAFESGLAVSQKDGKYGYVNEKLKPIINHQFDLAEAFIGERAITGIKYGSKFKYRLINKQGQYVGEFYDEIKHIGQNFYRVRNDVQGKKYGDTGYYAWQLMNADGVIITTRSYEIMDDFFNDRARVCIQKSCGFISSTGREVIALGMASNQELFSHVSDYSSGHLDKRVGKTQGYASGLSIHSKDGLKGYMDTYGKIIIAHQFKNANHFNDGVAVVETNDGIGVIDTQGNFIVKPHASYEKIHNFKEGVAVFIQNKKYAVMDKQGNIIVPTSKNYTKIYDFSHGTAMIKQDELFGMIDITGKEIIPPIYQDIFGDFDDGVIEAIKPNHPTELLHLNKNHEVVGKSQLTIVSN